jgi:hypothetical protein
MPMILLEVPVLLLTTLRAAPSSPNGTIPSMTSEPAISDPAGRRYPHKTSWYQSEADADRLRATFANTKNLLGLPSLSAFINAAINEKIQNLEASYNDGRPWAPLAAKEIPQGKPAGLPKAAAGREHSPTPRPLDTLVDRVRTALVHELGHRVTVNVFQHGNGLEAVVEAYSPKTHISILRHYEVFYADESVEVRTAADVSWVSMADNAMPPLLQGPGRPIDPVAELQQVTSDMRDNLAKDYSPPVGETKAFFAGEGHQSLIEVYDAGSETSTLRCFELNAKTSRMGLRMARNVDWEAGDSISFAEI